MADEEDICIICHDEVNPASDSAWIHCPTCTHLYVCPDCGLELARRQPSSIKLPPWNNKIYVSSINCPQSGGTHALAEAGSTAHFAWQVDWFLLAWHLVAISSTASAFVLSEYGYRNIHAALCISILVLVGQAWRSLFAKGRPHVFSPLFVVCVLTQLLLYTTHENLSDYMTNDISAIVMLGAIVGYAYYSNALPVIFLRTFQYFDGVPMALPDDFPMFALFPVFASSAVLAQLVDHCLTVMVNSHLYFTLDNNYLYNDGQGQSVLVKVIKQL